MIEIIIVIEASDWYLSSPAVWHVISGYIDSICLYIIFTILVRWYLSSRPNMIGFLMLILQILTKAESYSRIYGQNLRANITHRTFLKVTHPFSITSIVWNCWYDIIKGISANHSILQTFQAHVTVAVLPFRIQSYLFCFIGLKNTS